MLLLTLAGALLSFYIYYTDVFKIATICPTGGCAKVASSEYSKLLGIPVSMWGMIYYLGFGVLIMFKEKFSNFYKYLLSFFVFAGIVFTIYLRFVELFYIKAICIWCWGSVVIVVLLTILYFLSMRVDNEENPETN